MRPAGAPALLCALIAATPGLAEVATQPAASEAQPAARDAEPTDSDAMPAELPPLDDELRELLGEEEDGAGAPAPLLEGVSLLGEGRLRFELDESRDRLPVNDVSLGLALAGRVGLSAPVGPHRATIIVGDGRRVGQDFGLLASPLVDPTALGLLYTARLDLDVTALFLPATVSVGRFPFQVADGRWVGRADFDPRGRTFDGVTFAHRGELLDATVGAFYLGPYLAGDVADSSWLVTTELRRAADWYGISLYGLAHRDGTPPRGGEPAVAALTAGLRTHVEGFGARLALGADGQLPTEDTNPLTPAGWGAHAEAEARYAPPLESLREIGLPFLTLGGEWTGGEPVGGHRFRAPGPSSHVFLGALDVAAADNVASAVVELGFFTDAGFLASASARVLALSDPTGPLTDPTGRGLVLDDPNRTDALLLTEIDVHVRLPMTDRATLDAEYGVGFPGPAFAGGTTPIQRLLVGVWFALDTGS